MHIEKGCNRSLVTREASLDQQRSEPICCGFLQGTRCGLISTRPRVLQGTKASFRPADRIEAVRTDGAKAGDQRVRGILRCGPRGGLERRHGVQHQQRAIVIEIPVDIPAQRIAGLLKKLKVTRVPDLPPLAVTLPPRFACLAGEVCIHSKSVEFLSNRLTVSLVYRQEVKCPLVACRALLKE